MFDDMRRELQSPLAGLIPLLDGAEVAMHLRSQAGGCSKTSKRNLNQEKRGLTNAT